MPQVIIPDILPLTQAIAIGGQTVYSTTWTANYQSDVVVYSRPLNTPAADATQILSYPNQYSVAFIGDQATVQVTLVTPSTLGDVVTITRQTPADRLNLYTNTNFTPTMLNQDFGILTLVDQQAQLVNQQIGPRYNYSAFIQPVVDTILPILEGDQIWGKNSGDTAIIAIDIPPNGFAPADDTYILLTPDNVNLPNSFALSTLTAGILINDVDTNSLLTTTVTGTADQISISNPTGVSGPINVSIAINPIIPGTAGMGIPSGTTGQRAIPGSNISLRYNTTLGAIEYWTGTTWAQLNDDTHVNPGLINELAWYASSGSVVSGLTTVSAGVLTTVSSVPTWVTELGLSLGGTNASLIASNGGIVYSTATALAILAATSTANQIILSGSNAAPSWSTATYPVTTTINQLLYSSSNNTIVGLATANSSVFVTSITGVPTWLGPLTDGQIIIGSTGAIPVVTSLTEGFGVTITPGPGSITISATGSGGTVTSVASNNGITGGTITSSGTLGLAAIADHTLLANISGSSTFPSSTTLTALIDNAIGFTQGNVLYRNSTIWTVLAPGTNGQVLTTGGAAANPSWTTQGGSGTVTSGSINQLAWYAANGTVVSGLVTANSGVLVTSAGGVPSISSTLPPFTTSSITFSPSTGGIVGTTTNNDASAGYVGEIISSEIPIASGVPISNNTVTNITSITISAGDWDISGNVCTSNTLPATTAIIGSSNTVSATLPDFSKYNTQGTTGIGALSINIPSYRISVNGSTTIYLLGYVVFPSGTVTACGNIYARRSR